MIWVLIAIACLLSFVIAYFRDKAIFKKSCEVFNNSKYFKLDKDDYEYNGPVWSYVTLITGIIISLAFIICFLLQHVGVDASINSITNRRNTIISTCTQMFNTDDVSIIDKQSVIDFVYEWNTDCYNIHYWSDNIWTNWFYNPEITEAYQEISLEEVGLQ